MIELNVAEGSNVLDVELSGKLSAEDYDRFGPEMERLMETHGKVRILVEMRDFHGWDAGAMWADTKFAAKHFRDIEKLALVGDKKWEKGMAVFCKPFTTASVKYFDVSEKEEAKAWVTS